MHAYSDASERARAYAAMVFLAVLIALGANWLFNHYKVGPAWLISAPTVAAAYGILFELTDRLLWRLGPVRAAGFVRTPIVAGRYTGELISVWQGGTTLPISVEIEQTWTRLVVRFEVTNPQSSASISLAAALRNIGNDHARLSYFYRNSVQPGVADADMNDHDGTAEITINTKTGAVTGRYYNYRGRQGTLTLTRQP